MEGNQFTDIRPISNGSIRGSEILWVILIIINRLVRLLLNNKIFAGLYEHITSHSFLYDIDRNESNLSL